MAELQAAHYSKRRPTNSVYPSGVPQLSAASLILDLYFLVKNKEKYSAMHGKLRHYINRYIYERTRNMLPELEGGVGACGQDLLVHDLLNRKTDGVFVEIGANDGVTINNTVMFEKKFGWRGIAVEPIPAVFETLKANRNCRLIHGCVTSKPGKEKFLEVVGGPTMLSTLAMHNEGLTARRLKKTAARHKATLKEIDVNCYTFQSLIDDAGFTEVDFLSLDTEGGELEILKSIDFDKTPVRAISVENNYFTNSIRDYLESEGFIYIGTFKVDEIYLFGGGELRKKKKSFNI